MTDPPYGLVSIVKRFGKEGSAPAKFGTDGAFSRASKGFMGKEWDGSGIENNVEMWAEALRVLKPGGYLLAFSGTRTYHRMATAIEDAGFEVRDMIEWVYGSGFPKSLNIGKAVKALQETGGSSPRNLRKARMGEDYKPTGQEDYRKGRMFSSEIENDNIEQNINNEWEGWGTALKPAHEPICMARKPLAEKTVAENVLKYGTGGINIDESRVGTEDNTGRPHYDKEGFSCYGKYNDYVSETHSQGRFPANLITDGSEEVRECFPESGGGKFSKSGDRVGGNCEYSVGINGKKDAPDNYGDSGNASRFFKSIIYTAKASKSERNRGLDDFEEKQSVGGGGGIGDYQNDVNSMSGKYGSEKAPAKNNHPTVKPITLMEYLIKMITPKGGTVLDPFAGSGSTLVAAKQNSFNYIGIELDPEYIKIAEARINSIPQSLF